MWYGWYPDLTWQGAYVLMITMNDETKNNLLASSSKDKFVPTLIVGSLGTGAIVASGGIYSTYWAIEVVTDLVKHYSQFFL